MQAYASHDDGYARLLWPEERAAFRPPDDRSPAEWCNDNIVLPEVMTPAPGPYRWQRTPYMRDLLNLLARPSVRTINNKWATQVGKSLFGYLVSGDIVGQRQGNTAIYYASEGQARSVSRGKLQPLFASAPEIRKRIPADDSLYQTQEMHFPGMILYVRTAASEVETAQISVENLIRDEINDWPERMADGGDPLEKTAERIKAYKHTSRIINISSTTTENGNIYKEEQSCQVILGYFVPCPHCRRLQLLEWDDETEQGTAYRLRFERDKSRPVGEQIAQAKASAYYECRFCAGRITDRHKEWLLAPENGAGWFDINCAEPQPSVDSIGDLFREFRRRGQRLESIATRLNSIYSPFLSFGDVAEAFVKADTNPGIDRVDKQRDFTTDWLNREWRVVTANQSVRRILGLKGDLPAMTCPRETVAVTMGIDCQKRSFYWSAWAWARDWRRWMIGYGRVLSWDDIHRLVYKTAFNVAGTEHELGVWRAGIDTGGGTALKENTTMTREAYLWLAQHGGYTAFGLKGASRATSAKVQHSVVGHLPGTREAIPGAGVRLCTFDVKYFKDSLNDALGVAQGDANCVYLHSETAEDFAEHMCAERREIVKGAERWVHSGKSRNDWWDTSVYAAVVADPLFYGGINMVEDINWDKPDEAPEPEDRPRNDSRGGSRRARW